jgi:hypothetical protein
MSPQLNGHSAVAASYWGDDDPAPSEFDPVDVRCYFKSRFLYVTRWKRRSTSRLVRQVLPQRMRGTSRMRRVRRVARTCGSRGDPSEPELASPALPVGGAA